MKQEVSFDLGDKVKDRVTNYTGIVTSIAFHLSGCERYGVETTSGKRSDRGEREYFFDSQLMRIEKKNGDFKPCHLDNLDINTNLELGQIVKDKITGFEGVVTVINFKMWNCPYINVQSLENPDSDQWFDETLLESVDAEEDFVDFLKKQSSENEKNSSLETGAFDDPPKRISE